MSDHAKKLFMWSGNNNFKLSENPDLNEAARQREQIRKENAEWEANRGKTVKIPQWLAQMLGVK